MGASYRFSDAEWEKIKSVLPRHKRRRDSKGRPPKDPREVVEGIVWILLSHQVKDISKKQAQLVAEYKHTWKTIQHDSHFTVGELSYMSQVYSGILEQTVNNVDQLLLVVSSFVTQVPDAKRIDIIDSVSGKVDENYDALHQFNNQNALLSLQRAKKYK